jgi:hypothetical protein
MRKDDDKDKRNLPAVAPKDNWDNWFDSEDDETNLRLIQGTLIKCIDGVWTTKEGEPPPTKLLAMTTITILQRWEDERPVETIIKTPNEPLPSVDELNKKIPQKKWELGIDGEPRPPWQKQWIVYLMDPATASKYTFASGTIGARIAVSNLKDAVQWMCSMRGADVLPIVELINAPMKTKFGMKLRPNFKIVSWHRRGGDGGEEIGGGDGGLKLVKPVTTAEALNDEIPL